ncbi:hypothetical protein AM493_07560 [Flavobacterium akiainvivens]|uniref:Beta-carotene 15,15'-monooxygenase n=1 Tax=Flavobacterium akiainvivens TaxID=1202724 RepID=A0A0M8MHI9_9FLAO|nr:hypothetical protein [Flavobacterium akiainvivens]KOS05907.1 hypothetical protein AM493_07560 [Flavobacterium akiainvivens]SFQ55961.1 hypothetical protein SAMN05444144_1086 [Flavobacterium akiainvivens]
MDVLDKLKNDWNKSGNAYPSFSETEIYAMLHKKSSSIVKWILIISILEFAFWAICAVVTSIFGNDYRPPAFLEVLDYINYVVLIIFISIFYINYRKISAQNPVKQLLQNIINIRKVVKFYVIYNLCIISFSLVSALVIYGDDFSNSVNPEQVFAIGIVFIVVVFVLIYFIYRLLYGRLLKKLNENYIELQKIKEI